MKEDNAIEDAKCTYTEFTSRGTGGQNKKHADSEKKGASAANPCVTAAYTEPQGNIHVGIS